MALIKYIMQPIVGGNVQKYASAELQKIEKAIASLLIGIEELQDMNIERGSCVLTLTGCTTTPTVTARYIKIDDIVVLFVPAVTAVSNANTCTLTGLPASITPVVAQGKQWVNVRDNNAPENGSAVVETTGVITFRDASFTANGWTASSTKGVDAFNLVYILS